MDYQLKGYKTNLVFYHFRCVKLQRYNHFENNFIVAASYSGNDKTPDWFYNLSTDNPFITINNERFEATYELIESSEKEYYWSLLDEVYPTFQMYRKRTNRDIPLIKFSKA